MSELLFALISTRPEFKKPRECRKMLVGPMRQFLAQNGGAAPAATVEQFPGMPPKALEVINERAEAADALADFCFRCGRCKLGRWP